jgi:transposase
MDQIGGRRRRRRHSDEFKAEAVAACSKAGVSIAAVALARSINANLLRRWVLKAERTEAGSLVAGRVVAAQSESFVPLPVPAQPTDDTPIRIEVRRGAITLSVQWPRSALHECAVWLREVLR